MKIGIIGGGIFGVTIAIRLAKSHTVEIFEKNDYILKAGSDINQCRIHRGYHYPRSDTTAKELLESQEDFVLGQCSRPMTSRPPHESSQSEGS